MSKFILSNGKFVKSNGKFIVNDGVRPSGYSVNINAVGNGFSYAAYDGVDDSGTFLFGLGKDDSINETYNILSGNIYVSFNDSKGYVYTIASTGGVSGSGHSYSVTANGTLSLQGESN